MGDFKESSYEIRKGEGGLNRVKSVYGSVGAPGGIRTRQPANYKSAALPLRHWGIGEKKPKGSCLILIGAVMGSVLSRRSIDSLRFLRQIVT